MSRTVRVRDLEQRGVTGASSRTSNNIKNTEVLNHRPRQLSQLMHVTHTHMIQGRTEPLVHACV